MDQTEREAFDAFARGRMRELLRFAHVLTGDAHQAADLVQDALRTHAAGLAAHHPQGRSGGLRPARDRQPARQHVAAVAP